MCEDCCEDYEELRKQVEELKDFRDWVMNHLKPPVDDLRDAHKSQRDRLDAQDHRIDELESQFEAVTSVDENSETDRESRLALVRHALIKRAEARSESNQASMHWEEIADSFAENGHIGASRDVMKTWAYNAMDDVKSGRGFSLTTKQKNGQSVKAVKVDLTALPPSGGSNGIITSRGGRPGQNTAESD